MKYLNINESKIPALGLGTFQLKDDEALEIVKKALEFDYRHIDTAQIYENENEVGKAIEQSEVPRDDIFLTTKVWHTKLSKVDFLPSVHDSLEKLKTDYVDLLLIHWPPAELEQLNEAMECLVQAREEGLAKHIGVSNFTKKFLWQAIKDNPGIITNQIEYHPFINQDPILSDMEKYKISLTAYSPLAQGAIVKNVVVQAIAEKFDKTPAQIVLRWMMQQENVMAIPRTSKVERLKENMDVFDFELDKNAMDRLNALKVSNQRIINPPFAPIWD